MSSYSIYEAKTHLSKLIKAALAGKSVIIMHRGVPQVELRPIVPSEAGRRELGVVKGKWHMAEDFDATPAEFEEYLE